MNQYALGIDYGTNSCRALLVDLNDGSEVAQSVFAYPSGEMGILLDPRDPQVARQNPQDYLDGLERVTQAVLAAAASKIEGFDAAAVVGIGIDTTGSTPIPIDEHAWPLGLSPRWRDHLDAQVWLWKDHTAHAEAAEITELASQLRPEYLAKCGGIYSSEWWWSKILRLRRCAPEVFAAAHSFVEHCDWMVAVLTGVNDSSQIVRSICAAGHKAMFSPQWGGLPDVEFLSALHPDLGALRARLYNQAHPCSHRAGGLAASWAQRLGLPAGIAVAVGGFDAHMGAVGAGIREGVLVKILGTSTCDLMVAPAQRPLADIPGVCGIVRDSVLPDHFGIEAGQSAVGDLFLWLVNHLVPESHGSSIEEKFNSMHLSMAQAKPGASGLLALDWNNGNRTVLVDAQLSGLLVGQTLYTQAHEIYRAYIEATAFGALTIIRRVEQYGVEVSEVVTTGGLAVKNPLLMQIYADVINKPMKVSRSDQTCALGAALFGAVAAGLGGVAQLQQQLCATRAEVYHPKPEHVAVYSRLFELYSQLHDAFGRGEVRGDLGRLMKTLMEIRQEQLHC
jgi:L-ribulokinase